MSEISIQSIRSALTIDISSMIIISASSISLRFSPYTSLTDSLVIFGENLNNEWIVVPHTFMAATPVGAMTNTFLSVELINSLISVVLPVHAFPVRKNDWLVSFNKRNASLPILSRLNFAMLYGG